MTLQIDKELFQWEKDRVVFVNNEERTEEISMVQFYNKKSKYGPEVSVEDGKAKIPNFLLKENLPIVAVACVETAEGVRVVDRREFKVLARVKPEFYIDDEDTSKDVIYDGGVEV